VFPYDEYSSVDLDNMSEAECKAKFRFNKNDLPVLAEASQIPPFRYCTRKFPKLKYLKRTGLELRTRQ